MYGRMGASGESLRHTKNYVGSRGAGLRGVSQMVEGRR